MYYEPIYVRFTPNLTLDTAEVMFHFASFVQLNDVDFSN